MVTHIHDMHCEGILPPAAGEAPTEPATATVTVKGKGRGSGAKGRGKAPVTEPQPANTQSVDIAALLASARSNLDQGTADSTAGTEDVA